MQAMTSIVHVFHVERTADNSSNLVVITPSADRVSALTLPRDKKRPAANPVLVTYYCCGTKKHMTPHPELLVVSFADRSTVPLDLSTMESTWYPAHHWCAIHRREGRFFPGVTRW